MAICAKLWSAIWRVAQPPNLPPWTQFADSVTAHEISTQEAMTVTTNRACPACGGHAAESFIRQRFVLEEGHTLSNGYSVVQCAVCGFAYADVAATQADYDAYYAKLSKYDDPATSTGSGESPLDRQRLEGTAAILDGILASKEARILDIGCAGGGLLAALQRSGYVNLVGADPSPACARQTRERIGEAYAGWITSLPPEIGTFDCIILSHVMEHVLDVAGAMTTLRPLLRPNGRVYIEVPDATRYADHIYAPYQDFNTEHINHFSPVTLDNAMSARGFVNCGGGERLLHSSAHSFTPAIFRVYSASEIPDPLVPDTALRPAILRYMQRSAELLAAIDRRIATALAVSDELIVWGTGQLTLKLLIDSCLSKARVVAFVDSNPIHQGRLLAGAPILSPSSLGPCLQPILIGTTLHHREIARQIEMLGLKNDIILLPEGGPAFFGEAVTGEKAS
jgi:SAM-dependent methyltransferase